MNCDEAYEFWGKSLREKPASPESEAFTSHLSGCSRCRREFQWDAAIIGALVKNPEIEPARNFTADVCSRIAEIESAESSSLRQYIKFSPAFIISVFAVLAAWVLYNGEIMHLIQSLAFAFEEQSAWLTNELGKVSYNSDGLGEFIHPFAGFMNQFSWTLTAFIVSLIIFVTYLVNIFAVEKI